MDNMFDFIEKIKGKNKEITRRTVIAGIAVICIAMLIFAGNGDDESEELLVYLAENGVLGFAGIIYLLAEFTVTFCRQYVTFCQTEGNVTTTVLLYENAKSQDINIKELSTYLRKKIVKWQAVITVTVFIISVIWENISVGVATVILCMILPQITINLYFLYFNRRFHDRKNHMAIDFIGGILNFLSTVAILATLYMTGALFFFVSVGMFEKEFPDGHLVYRYYGDIVVILLVAVCTLYFIFTGTALGKTSGFMKKVRWTTGIAMVICYIAIVFLQSRYFFEIDYSDKVVRIVNKTEKLYSFSDITDVVEDTEDGSYKCIIFFSDSNSVVINLDRGLESFSDEFAEKYDDFEESKDELVLKK